MTFQSGKWASGHLCHVLTKNLPSSWPCPQAEFKGNESICSVVEIPREDSIQAVVWLLLADLIYVYSKSNSSAAERYEKWTNYPEKAFKVSDCIV